MRFLPRLLSGLCAQRTGHAAQKQLKNIITRHHFPLLDEKREKWQRKERKKSQVSPRACFPRASSLFFRLFFPPLFLFFPFPFACSWTPFYPSFGDLIFLFQLTDLSARLPAEKRQQKVVTGRKAFFCTLFWRDAYFLFFGFPFFLSTLSSVASTPPSSSLLLA